MAYPTFIGSPPLTRDINGAVSLTYLGTPPTVVTRSWGAAWHHQTSSDQSTIIFGSIDEYLEPLQEYTWFFEFEFIDEDFVDYPVAHLSATEETWDMTSLYIGDVTDSPHVRIAQRYEDSYVDTFINGTQVGHDYLEGYIPLDGVMAYYAPEGADRYSGPFILYANSMTSARILEMTHPSYHYWTWEDTAPRIGGLSRTFVGFSLDIAKTTSDFVFSATKQYSDNTIGITKTYADNTIEVDRQSTNLGLTIEREYTDHTMEVQRTHQDHQLVATKTHEEI